jgi:hypothetical protein
MPNKEAEQLFTAASEEMKKMNANDDNALKMLSDISSTLGASAPKSSPPAAVAAVGLCSSDKTNKTAKKRKAEDDDRDAADDDRTSKKIKTTDGKKEEAAAQQRRLKSIEAIKKHVEMVSKHQSEAMKTAMETLKDQSKDVDAWLKSLPVSSLRELAMSNASTKRLFDLNKITSPYNTLLPQQFRQQHADVTNKLESLLLLHHLGVHFKGLS